MTSSLVFFDGICNLCDSTVHFLLKIDTHKRLQFGSLQGEAAKKILPAYQIDPEKLRSIIFIHNNKVFTESSAVLEILRVIGGIWSILYISIIIPAFIRNAFYRLIARNRYQWFGKKEQCMIPQPKYLNRFLD